MSRWSSCSAGSASRCSPSTRPSPRSRPSPSRRRRSTPRRPSPRPRTGCRPRTGSTTTGCPTTRTACTSCCGVARGAIWRRLRDDRHNLAGLAAEHGWPDRGQARDRARRAARGRGLRPRRSALLRARALRTLTQGHLSQHLLFHSLHQFAIPSEAPAIFGVTDAQFRTLRRAEQSPLEIGRLHGRSPAKIQALSDAVLRERVRFGISSDAMTARQGRLLLRRQVSQLPRWLAQVRYNGPPPTHLGKLTGKPRNFAANPALSADGTQRRLRGLRAEAAGRAQARRDQRARPLRSPAASRATSRRRAIAARRARRTTRRSPATGAASRSSPPRAT